MHVRSEAIYVHAHGGLAERKHRERQRERVRVRLGINTQWMLIGLSITNSKCYHHSNVVHVHSEAVHVDVHGIKH